MIKIEAVTLEEAYSNAASKLNCSVTELVVEVVQYPSSGFLGLFRKKAIIVATKESSSKATQESASLQPEAQPEPAIEEQQPQENLKNDLGVPSFVSPQEEEPDSEEEEISLAVEEAVKEIDKELKALFGKICFELDEVRVSAYNENTVYVEINGADAALLIGKEGYRYKALSYMIFNWINAKYGLQLRLEIAEFLKNQEEAVNRYLEGVKENIERDGRAQTKILDGVLVQIALRELRATYPDKYVAIRTTRDGLKYIIVNDYNY